MKVLRYILSLALSAIVPLAAVAVTDGTSSADQVNLGIGVGVKKKFNKKFTVAVDAELRSHEARNIENPDKVDSYTVERWSIGIQGVYSPLKYLKLDAGYQFIYKGNDRKLTNSGKSIVDSYWQSRHRAFASITGQYKFNHFTLSLRERYQYTHYCGLEVPKHGRTTGKEKDPKIIDAKDKHLLRSRLQLKYEFSRIGLEPYVSAEIFNDLSDKLTIDRTRFTFGCDYSINKHHGIGLFYRYQLTPSAKVEPYKYNVHLVEATYSFTF